MIALGMEPVLTMQRCSMCRETKAMEAFSRNQNQCKVCRCQTECKYRLAHHEQILQKNRQYREAHREQLRESSRQYTRLYRLDHPEHARSYRQAHTEDEHKYGAEYRRAHLEQTRQRHHDYYQAKPEMGRAAAHRRRAVRANVQQRHNFLDIGLTDPTWKRGVCCVLCNLRIKKIEFSVDHLVPLTKGGPEAPFNKAPCHLRCNRSKGNRFITTTQPTLIIQTTGGD